VATSTIAKAWGGTAALCLLERTLFASPSSENAVPALFGLVILLNCVGTSFALLVLGMKVGGARKKHGVAYPQMYATGTSAEDVKFNCIQRGHQQALETYPSFLACSLAGGFSFPLVTAAAGAVWIVARLKWAAAYAENGADGRYSSAWSRFIWHSLLCVFATASCTAFALLGRYSQ